MDNQNLGELVDEMRALRDKKHKIEAKFKPQVEGIVAEMSLVEQHLQALMFKAGTLSAKGIKGSYNLKESDEPVLDDSTKFFAWVIRSGNIQCLQRRLSPPAIKEVVATIRGKRIPGIKFVKKVRGTLSNLKA